MDVVLDNLGAYLRGMATTASLTALSFAAALVLGIVMAVFRVSPVAPLRAVGSAYVGLFRNTPLTVLFFLFFFGFTKVGVRYDEFTSAVIVLAVYTGTFVAETVRAGINAVSRGQAEAARAIGLTFGQTLKLVVLPQALRTVVAPLGSVLIALIKNSSLASIINVVDLTGVADRVNTATAMPIAAFLGAAAGYVLLSVPTGLAVGRLERAAAIRR